MKVLARALWPLLLAACSLVESPCARAQTSQTPPATPRPYHHVTGFVGGWLEEFDRPEEFGRPQSEWVLAGSYGLGYEYRTSNNKGLVFFLQRATGEAEATALGGGIGVHFSKGWWILVGSYWENSERRGNTGRIRFGLNKEFRVGAKKRTTITPTFNFDMAEEGLIFVFGLNVGHLF